MEVIQACHVKKIEKIALVSEGLIALLEMETNTFLSFNIKNIKNKIRQIIPKPVTNSNIKQYCFFDVGRSSDGGVCHMLLFRCIGYIGK